MSNASSEPKPVAVASPKGGITWHPLTAVLILVLGYFVAQAVGALLVSAYPYLRHWSASQGNDRLDNSIGAQFVYVLISEVILVGAIYRFVRWRKGNVGALGVRHPRGRDVGYASLGVLVYVGLYIIAVTVLTAAVHLNLNQKQDLGFQNPTGAFALTLTFVSLVLLPPLAEEFAFRGFLFSSLRRRLGFWVSTLIVSGLFAVPHLMEGDGSLLWIAGVDTFLLSLVLCYLRERAGRLWAGIMVHMFKNGIAFVSLFLVHTH